MADSDNTLKLLIELGVIGQADAEAANKLLEESKAATAGLSEEAKRSQQPLSQLEDNLKKGGRAAEEAALSHRELKTGLLDIGNIAAPGAGRALMKLSMDPIDAALALVDVYEMVRKKIEEVDKQEEELNAKELATHLANIASVTKAWDDARQGSEKYAIAVKAAGQDKDPASTRLKEIKEISAAQTESILKEIEMLGQLRVARLKANGGSPDEIAKAEQDTKDAETRVKDAAANRSLDQIQKDIDARKERQSDFDSTAAAEQNRVARADIAVDSAKANLATASPENVKMASDALDAAQAAWDKIKDLPDTITTTFGTMLNPDKPNGGKTEKANLDAAQGEEERLKKAAELATAQLAAANAEKIAADAALAKVNLAGESNKAKIREETEEVKIGRAVQAEKEKGEAEAAAIQAQITATKTAGKDFATGQGIASTAEHGGNVSDSQAQYLITLEQSITGQRRTFASAVKLIEAQSANHAVMESVLDNAMQRISTMSQRLSQLESQFGHSSNTQGGQG